MPVVHAGYTHAESAGSKDPACPGCMREDLASLRAELAEAREHLALIRGVVDAQAEDDGLWFRAQTAPEAYLQAALRKLHAAVERALKSPAPGAK